MKTREQKLNTLAMATARTILNLIGPRRLAPGMLMPDLADLDAEDMRAELVDLRECAEDIDTLEALASMSPSLTGTGDLG